jgi:hypothetical protein
MKAIESIEASIRADASFQIVSTPDVWKLHKRAHVWLGRNLLSLELKNNVWRLKDPRELRFIIEDAIADTWLDLKGTLGLIPVEIASTEEFVTAHRAMQVEGGDL